MYLCISDTSNTTLWNLSSWSRQELNKESQHPARLLQYPQKVMISKQVTVTGTFWEHQEAFEGTNHWQDDNCYVEFSKKHFGGFTISSSTTCWSESQRTALTALHILSSTLHCSASALTVTTASWKYSFPSSHPTVQIQAQGVCSSITQIPPTACSF